MKKTLFLMLFCICSLSINAQVTNNAQQFLGKLSNHCHKAYAGKIVSSPVPDDFKDKELIMYVISCSEKEVKIPFFVGEDLSRTWVFTLKEDFIQLKHDHRQKDGTSDEITMYGGTSTNVGRNDIQFFPADQETVAMLPAAAGNVWWVTITDTEYTYNLRRVDTGSFFSVVFDLTKEIETNKRPW